MDEDIAIIDNNTRREKLKNFIIKNKKFLIYLISLAVIFAVIFFSFQEYKKMKKIEISDLYNSTIIGYSEEKKEKTIDNLINIINKKDPTYSPLSLYFIIDNNLVLDKKKMDSLFDKVIFDSSLEKEIKNLLIYKKALFYADDSDENSLLGLLNPLINSESIWKSHALYLVAEYFYSKNEKQKSKEFFLKIIDIENANPEIIKEAQKRLNRDFSE
tara:strand:+ start:572 stop:1216 length:645 start_codon:yes stop_codon:yes gene_type:complete